MKRTAAFIIILIFVVLLNCDGFRLMCNRDLRLLKENNLLTTENYGASEPCDETEFYPVVKSEEDTFQDTSGQSNELDLYKTTTINPDVIEEYYGTTSDYEVPTTISASVSSVTVSTPENSEDIEHINLNIEKMDDYTITNDQNSFEVKSNENVNISAEVNSNINVSEEVASPTKSTSPFIEENNSNSLEMPYSQDIEIIQREDIYPTIKNITENNSNPNLPQTNNNNNEFLEHNETELDGSNTEIKSYKNPFDSKLIKFGSTIDLHELANKNLKRDLEASKRAQVNTNSIVSERTNAFLNATSAERAEIISKAIDKFVQVINIFGQVDSYFTGRVKSSIKKLAKLCEDDGPFL